MVSPQKDPVLLVEELARTVDRRFAAIQQRRTGCMECRSGCSDCCRARLSITRVEEAFLRRGLARLDPSVRRELAAATREEGREMCPALDPQGRCRVYAARPLICRSFGVPLRRRREVPLVNPPTVDACDKNFVGMPLHALPNVDVLDQTDLEAAVGEIDAGYCAENGLPAGERVPIARILATPDGPETR